MHRRHDLGRSKLAQFSYRIFQIKFIIFELAFFLLSLYGLYQVVKREFGW